MATLEQRGNSNPSSVGQTTQGSPTIERKSELASLMRQRFFCDKTMEWSLAPPSLTIVEGFIGGFE